MTETPAALELETSRRAHIAALAFVMLFPTLSTLVYFVLLSGTPAMKVVYFGCKVLQFAFPLAWVIWIQKRRIRWSRPQRGGIVPGLIAGVLIVLAGLGAYFGLLKESSWLQNAPKLIGLKIDDMGLTNPVMYLSFSLFLAVPHSLLEEYYWRWFAFGELRRIVPLKGAVLLSSLAFMAHHVIVIHQFLQASWVATAFLSLCVAFGGGVWAWIYHRSDSLYGPWFSHLMVDCAIMLIGFDLIPWS